jgi:hypothetical protein
MNPEFGRGQAEVTRQFTESYDLVWTKVNRIASRYSPAVLQSKRNVGHLGATGQ